MYLNNKNLTFYKFIYFLYQSHKPYKYITVCMNSIYVKKKNGKSFQYLLNIINLSNIYKDNARARKYLLHTHH